jgi:sporulation protein YunB
MAAIMLLGGVSVALYEKKLSPIVTQTAIYTVTDVVTELVNDIIMDKIQSGMLDYDNLVTVEKDSSGNISALITNMANANLLQSMITNEVIQKISDNFTADMRIPLGNIIGGTLFYGRGPLIPVKLKSVTNVSAIFENEFSSAGINQTRHQIKLKISVDVMVLIPGQELVDTVQTGMVIAETVVVGSVPENYANITQ